jgi:sec-independent protein translocase protein TatA
MVGSQSVLMLLGVVLLLFGGKKLPELAGALGRSMSEFRKGMESVHGPGQPEAAVTPVSPTPAPAPPAAMAAAAPCATCGTALQPDWAHCPRCGGATPAPGPRPSAG